MRSTLVPLLFVPTLLAQRAAEPMSFVPDDAVAVARVQCGARSRDQLAATRVGKTLADPALAGAWTDAAAVLREQATPAVRRVLDAVPDIVDGYGGEIVLALRMDGSKLLAAVADRSAPDLGLLIAFGPDARTDPATLAAKVAMLLPPGDVPLQRLAGHDVPVHTVEHGAVSRPFVVDGNVLLLAGTDLAAHAERFLGDGRKPLDVAPEFRSSLASAQLTLPPGLVERLLATALGKNLTDDPVPALRLLGLSSLRRAGWLLQPDGPHLDQLVWLDFEGERGLFGAALPVRSRPPAVLRLVPPSCRTFATHAVDVQAAWTLLGKVWDALGTAVPPREQLLAQFTKATQVRLDEDLVATLGDEVLELTDVEALANLDDDEGDELVGPAARARDRFGDTCYVLTLRDGARFAASVETLLRSRGLHAARKTETYAGVKVHRLSLLGALTIEYAVTDRFVVVGVGAKESTARLLRGVLDAAGAEAKGVRPALPDDIAALLATMPGGWSRLEVASLLDVVQQLAALTSSLEGALADEQLTLADAGSQLALLSKFVTPLQQVMKRHGADVALTTGTTTATRHTMRTRM